MSADMTASRDFSEDDEMESHSSCSRCSSGSALESAESEEEDEESDDNPDDDVEDQRFRSKLTDHHDCLVNEDEDEDVELMRNVLRDLQSQRRREADEEEDEEEEVDLASVAPDDVDVLPLIEEEEDREADDIEGGDTEEDDEDDDGVDDHAKAHKKNEAQDDDDDDEEEEEEIVGCLVGVAEDDEEELMTTTTTTMMMHQQHHHRYMQQQQQRHRHHHPRTDDSSASNEEEELEDEEDSSNNEEEVDEEEEEEDDDDEEEDDDDDEEEEIATSSSDPANVALLFYPSARTDDRVADLHAAEEDERISKTLSKLVLVPDWPKPSCSSSFPAPQPPQKPPAVDDDPSRQPATTKAATTGGAKGSRQQQPSKRSLATARLRGGGHAAAAAAAVGAHGADKIGNVHDTEEDVVKSPSVKLSRKHHAASMEEEVGDHLTALEETSTETLDGGAATIALSVLKQRLLSRSQLLADFTSSHPKFDPQMLCLALQDCYTRFVLNLPLEFMANQVHVCFAIQEAYWWYTDFWAEKHKLPKLSMENYGVLLVEVCPVLRLYFAGKNYGSLLEEWRLYCRTIPLRGGILLDPKMERAVFVQSWKGDRWMFPRGKIDEQEEDEVCAVRELREELGVDLEGVINPHVFISCTVEGQSLKLYVVPGILESTPFGPRKRKEIGDIRWIPLASLPGWPCEGKRRGGHYSRRSAADVMLDGKFKFWATDCFVAALSGWVSLLRKGAIPRTRVTLSDARAGENGWLRPRHNYGFPLPPENYNDQLLERYRVMIRTDGPASLLNSQYTRQAVPQLVRFCRQQNLPELQDLLLQLAVRKVVPKKKKKKKIHNSATSSPATSASLHKMDAVRELSNIALHQPAEPRIGPLPPFMSTQRLYQVPPETAISVVRSLQFPQRPPSSLLSRRSNSQATAAAAPVQPRLVERSILSELRGLGLKVGKGSPPSQARHAAGPPAAPGVKRKILKRGAAGSSDAATATAAAAGVSSTAASAAAAMGGAGGGTAADAAAASLRILKRPSDAPRTPYAAVVDALAEERRKAVLELCVRAKQKKPRRLPHAGSNTGNSHTTATMSASARPPTAEDLRGGRPIVSLESLESHSGLLPSPYLSAQQQPLQQPLGEPAPIIALPPNAWRCDPPTKPVVRVRNAAASSLAMKPDNIKMAPTLPPVQY